MDGDVGGYPVAQALMEQVAAAEAASTEGAAMDSDAGEDLLAQDAAAPIRPDAAVEEAAEAVEAAEPSLLEAAAAHLFFLLSLKPLKRLQGRDKPLRAGVSKSPMEREISGHRAYVRGICREIQEGCVDLLEHDYHSGTTWAGTSNPRSLALRRSRPRSTVTNCTGPKGSTGMVTAGSTCQPWRKNLGSTWKPSRRPSEVSLADRTGTVRSLFRLLDGTLDCTLDLLPTSLRALRDSQSGNPQIVGLQEVRRGTAGWSLQAFGKQMLLSYQPEVAWRSTGILFDTTVWQPMRKKGGSYGTWFRMRHLHSISRHLTS